MDEKIKDAEKWYDENKRLYEQFSIEMATIITKLLKAHNIPYQNVSYRIKEKESYLNKCKNEKYDEPISQIMDVSGIRIIAYTNQDVQKICKILQEEFLIDKNNSINKADILKTDKVGYLSIHYILQLAQNRLSLAEYSPFKDLKCEVQIRTLLQHAWAEIEHDRNYKFAGVLPHEIQRRFYLVAGVLEMMDCEFDKLSKDIDEYIKNMTIAVSKGDYNLNIDSKSLEQYVLKRFENSEYIKACKDGTIVSEDVVKELLKFGYKTIQDIENDLNKQTKDFFSKRIRTFIGILRDLMITQDCDRYFNTAYEGSWNGVHKESLAFWKENGAINVEKCLQQKGINFTD